MNREFIMKTDNFARIILRSDGSTHIALRNSQTFICTAVALKTLLEDPFEFEEKGYINFVNSTRYVNPKNAI